MTVGATRATAPLRRRVRRESFTEWLPSRRTQAVALTIFAELCQFSGASTDAPAHGGVIPQRRGRANRRTGRAVPQRLLLCSPAGARQASLHPRRRASPRCRSAAFGSGCRTVRFGIQERDDVGALAAARQPGKAHLGAGDEARGIGQERVEVLDRPVAALAPSCAAE